MSTSFIVGTKECMVGFNGLIHGHRQTACRQGVVPGLDKPGLTIIVNEGVAEVMVGVTLDVYRVGLGEQVVVLVVDWVV